MPKKIKNTKLDFDPQSLFENLSENDKAEFLANCSLIALNPAFQRVCSHLGTEETLNTIEVSETLERLHFGRGRITGISDVLDVIFAYHAEHLATTRPEEPYDKNEVI
jgi:hypothetical protein